jgi:mannosyltransferase OCH1-like enzyme
MPSIPEQNKLKAIPYLIAMWHHGPTFLKNTWKPLNLTQIIGVEKVCPSVEQYETIDRRWKI